MWLQLVQGSSSLQPRSIGVRCGAFFFLSLFRRLGGITRKGRGECGVSGFHIARVVQAAWRARRPLPGPARRFQDAPSKRDRSRRQPRGTFFGDTGTRPFPTTRRRDTATLCLVRRDGRTATRPIPILRRQMRFLQPDKLFQSCSEAVGKFCDSCNTSSCDSLRCFC